MTPISRRVSGRFPGRKAAFAAASLTALLFAGCLSDPGPKQKKPGLSLLVKAELLRVAAGSAPGTPAKRAAGQPLVPGQTPGAISSDFKILSLRVPVMEIRLTKLDTDNQHVENAPTIPVYQCAGTANDDCLVDLAAGSALQDLLDGAALPVQPGEFGHITLGYCRTSPTHTVYLRGEVMLRDTLRYTKADGSLSAIGPAEEAPIVLNGCGTAHALIEPIAIAAPDETDSLPAKPDSLVIPVKLYYDLQGLAWGEIAGFIVPPDPGPGSPGGGPSRADTQVVVSYYTASCSIDSTALYSKVGASYFCINHIGIAATVDTAYPVVERYRIGTQAASSSATAALFFSATGGKPLAGYGRLHFTEDGAFENQFYPVAHTFMKFEDLGGGNYRIGGRVLPNDGVAPNPGEYWPLFPQFRRETHAGFMVDHYVGTEYPYTAVKLP